MSVNRSLWEIDIPYRKWAYLALYVGLVISILSVLFMSAYGIMLGIGVGIMALSSAYISRKLYVAGFRRNAVVFFLSILAVCAVSVAIIVIFENVVA